MSPMLVIALILACVALFCVAFLIGQRQGPPEKKRLEPTVDLECVSGRQTRGLSEATHWLMGIAGDVAGRAFDVGGKPITIGRASENGIVVSNDDASREHCRIESKGKWLEITDLKSRNGTKINDETVTTGRMEPGDELLVGTALFTFQILSTVGQSAVLTRSQEVVPDD